jgi:hypothetical protein
MSPSALVKSPARALAPVQTTAEARAQLAAARARLVQRLETVQVTVAQRLEPLADWRGVVRRHPLAAFGGALLAGYVLGRLFSRK